MTQAKSTKGTLGREFLDDEKLPDKTQNMEGSSTHNSPELENSDLKMIMHEVQNSMFGQGQE